MRPREEQQGQDKGGAKLGPKLVWGVAKEVGRARVGRLKAKW